MRDIMDLHTHTLASGHAYNTIKEQITAAREKEIELLGITEHAPDMPGSCKRIYFENMTVLNRKQQGLTVLFGTEVNILDYEGRVDLPNSTLKNMDLVIASMHAPCYRCGSKQENTAAYLKVMNNPYVNIIGHPDDGRFEIDHKALVEKSKEKHILIEMNASSLASFSYRVGAADNYKEILKWCRQLNTPIVINSDAHTDELVGEHQMAWDIINQIDFPMELIVNSEINRVKSYLNYFKK